jgi:hypothetical protein
MTKLCVNGMNTQTFFLVAGLVLALGLVGAVTENVIMTPQQAFADKPWGCDKKSNADDNSGGNCSHTGHRGN